MSSVFAAVEEVTATLTDAGITATSDPRNVSVPGVWVTVDRARVARLCGDVETVVSLVLIARDTGHRLAVRALSDLLDRVLAVIVPDGDAVADTITLPAGGSPLPALTLTTTVT